MTVPTRVRSLARLSMLMLGFAAATAIGQNVPRGAPGVGTPMPPTQPVPQPPQPLPLPPAIPGGPVAPGSIQPPPVMRPPPSTAPTIWVFANPKGAAIGPTSAELNWKAREGATAYRVWRNGVAIAEIAAKGEPAFKIVDAGLAPNSLNSYKVWALQPQDPRAEVKDRSGMTLLEESNPTSVGTPAIVSPTNITASFVSANPNVVRLTWSNASSAVAYRVYRDGQVIQGSFGGTAIDDAGVSAGTHVYAVQSLYAAPAGAQISGAMSSAVKIRVGPFNMIAVGDSVMWGQGLADAPGQPHKFVTRVREWVQSSMGKPVTMLSFAHSGATIAPGTPSEETMIMPGEVPSSFPSITRQALTDAPAALANAGISADDVDLVLVDGCINDVGVGWILDPSQGDQAIIGKTSSLCTGMANLLTGIRGTFKNAKIIVVGYWAIVSSQSDLTAVASLVITAGIVVGPAAAATVGIPLDPVTGAIAGAITSSVLRDKLVAHSSTFAAASDTTLISAVGTVNSAMGAGWVSFVRPGFKIENAYAAPSSWLWLVPTDLFPKDEVFAQRQQTCGTVQFQSGADAAKCVEASMGHPNVPGAQAYANAITAELASSSLSVWRKTHAVTQHAP